MGNLLLAFVLNSRTGSFADWVYHGTGSGLCKPRKAFVLQHRLVCRYEKETVFKITCRVLSCLFVVLQLLRKSTLTRLEALLFSFTRHVQAHQHFQNLASLIHQTLPHSNANANAEREQCPMMHALTHNEKSAPPFLCTFRQQLHSLVALAIRLML